MNPEVLAIANEWPLWIVCAVVVVLVIIQAAWFVKLCRKEADYISYPQKSITTAIKTGAIAAIGPAFAGIVVMLGMMTVIGGPITWQRLSIIGAAQTELTAATLASQAMGFALGDPGYNVAALTVGFLGMAINGCGWLLFTAIFTGSMESVRQKVAGGDPRWLVVLSSAITAGLFANMISQRLQMGKGQTIGTIVGFMCQFLLEKFVGPKVPAIKGYAIGISLIAAIIVAAIFYPMHIK